MKIEGTQKTAAEEQGEEHWRGYDLAPGGSATIIDIYVERLSEGVFLGVSPDVPGLTVETDSRDEMIEEARKTAVALLELAGRADAERMSFRFIEFG